MRIGQILGSATVGALMLASTSASAIPISFSFGFAAIGDWTVNSGSGNIEALGGQTTKTLAGSYLATTCAGFVAGCAALGIVPGVTVPTISLATLPVVNGVTAFTLSAGSLVASFTSALNNQATATTGSVGGQIKIDFLGTVTGDGGYGILGQTASLTETCNQTNLGAVISCSDTFATPAAVDLPEPGSLALLGAGLFGIGALRRRKQKQA